MVSPARSIPSAFKFWFGSRRAALVGWSVFAIGLLVTLAVHAAFVRSEEQRRARGFNRRIDDQIDGLRQSARNFEARFEGIRTLLEFSTQVTHADFHGAGAKLLRNLPSLSAVEWAPLIRDDERDALEAQIRAQGYPNFAIRNRISASPVVEMVVAPREPEYLPIVYRVPGMPISDALGFNMFTALRRLAAQTAQQTGLTMMSERSRLFGEDPGVSGFLLFVPVFHFADPGSPDPTAERGAFRGLIVGIIRLDRFLSVIFAPQPGSPKHELLINDQQPQFLGSMLGLIDEFGNVNQENVGDVSRFSEPSVVHRTVTVWGRSLHLSFRPIRPGGAAWWTLNRGVDLVAGFLVSSAFGLLAFSTSRRTALVARQVALRTEELQATQLKLEQDIAHRTEVEERLRTSEQRFRSLFDHHPDAVASLDLQGRLLSANLVIERLTGYSLAEIGQMNFRPLVAPEAVELVEFNFRRAAAGEAVNFEHPAIRKNGERFFLNVTLLPIVVNGEIVGLFGIAKDITSARRVTRELESFFALSAEMMGIAVVDGYFRRVNRAFEQRLGYLQGELLAVPFIEFVHPDDRAATQKEMAKLTQGVPTVAFENRCRAYNGLYRTFAWSIRGEPAEGILYAVAHDVTEQRLSQARIREQASLLDKARDAILVYGLDYRITFWNKSAERLYGWTEQEALGRDVRELIYHDHRSSFEAAHAALLTDDAWMGELRQTSQEGRAIVGEVRWTLVRNEAGLPYSVLSISTDITEQKKVEAQFLRAQRVESLGTLASGIAHDLNNVLAPILMAIGLLKTTARDDSDLRILSTIDISARRGADMVRQILAFARGDEGQQVPIPPEHLFREVSNVIAETFPKSIRCEVHVPRGAWPILGDPTQLTQVLLNLCVNARDAMPEGGTLILKAENIVLDDHYVKLNHEGRAGPHVLLQVSDTGTGIPVEIRDKIFDPFFTTKEVGKGTGLGLSTVLTIVRTSHGFLRLNSEPGKGTTFKIYFPAGVLKEPEIEPVTLPAEMPRGDGELVLVVDDEPSVRVITKRTLEAFGYAVVLAEDGAAALALYEKLQEEIAVMLVDMMMPVMDGPTLIRAVRTLNPRVRIVAASGIDPGPADPTNAHPPEPFFIPKPYTAGTLLETLARALGKL